MALQRNSNNSSSNSRPDDDDGGGGGNSKKDKLPPAKATFLTQIKNSPPAPPLTLQQQLCRRRRRSDLALFLIGISTCLLSVLHIVWHSDHLPHSYNTDTNNAGTGKLKGKSALQHKLDEFVKAREKRSKRTFRVNSQTNNINKGGRKIPFSEEEAQITSTSKKQNDNMNMQNHPIVSKNNKEQPHPVAHLSCADHGGPNNQQIIEEMVFWSDIPSDSSYLSPMHPLNDPHTPNDMERFLTFEPDSGGWNNIRMAMETALVMSHAMGRTLVLPPEQRMYLLDKLKGEQQSSFGFNDFFHLDAISIEHRGFKVITMEEFLVRVGRAGELRDFHSREILYPPGNETNYGTGRSHEFKPLWKYLRTVGNAPEWDPWECALAIPSSTEPHSIVELNETLKSIMDGTYGKPKPTLEEFNGHPTSVTASMAERMREMLGDRNNLCIYDKPLQESKLIHLKVEKGTRLLTHFYAFIFFADWRQDLWSKRFVRDHLRYVDEIICAAARVVEAVRDYARNNENHKPSRDEGIYDAMHVRRGDFQFPPTQLPADELYDLSKGELTEGATVYVATDERKKTFFDIFKKHYDVVFLEDFHHVIPDVNTNYYGMIDQ